MVRQHPLARLTSSGAGGRAEGEGSSLPALGLPIVQMPPASAAAAAYAVAPQSAIAESSAVVKALPLQPLAEATPAAGARGRAGQ